ncbi:MAG TPA: hypothetical protein PLP42_19260 [Acidobacteriota bacterium]|nr:hypothetical protein [Acidobacteriota bacterium]
MGVTPSYRLVGAILKESERQIDTAIAVVNPNDTDGIVWVDLIDDQSGSIVASSSITLPPRGQKAMFIWELFPELEGQDWHGSVRAVTWTWGCAGTMVRTLGGFATAAVPCASF